MARAARLQFRLIKQLTLTRGAVLDGGRDLVLVENLALVSGVSWRAFDQAAPGWHDPLNAADGLVVSGPVQDQTGVDDFGLAVGTDLKFSS